jgi:predicted adenine nucleotide alpha hydrolase (AANH) superfamily ATPase
VVKVLLHICCAPCTIYPLRVLRGEGFTVQGYFFNPNIHPWKEYEKRKETLVHYAAETDLEVIFDEKDALKAFLEQTYPWDDHRCRACYHIRLEAAARQARALNLDAFSTTLLYSRRQKHDWIKETGEDLGLRFGVPFLYRDFRLGWQEGIRISKELGLYRQPYCGCLFSEKERYAPKNPSQATVKTHS